MLQRVITYLSHFFSIIYPNLCYVCWAETPIRDRKICVNCLVDLPYTDHFKYNDNLVTRKFWGRVDIKHGAALINFGKGSKFTDMIHRFKYEGKKNIGPVLGKMAGRRLSKSPWGEKIDVIIPVPLHPARRAKRGYNQSTEFAKGISETTNIPIVENLLLKVLYTSSQTDKSRSDRVDNVLGSFSISDHHRYTGRHFLIVDDVITTGATVEACAIKLLEIPDAKISVLTLAVARF